MSVLFDWQETIDGEDEVAIFIDFLLQGDEEEEEEAVYINSNIYSFRPERKIKFRNYNPRTKEVQKKSESIPRPSVEKGHCHLKTFDRKAMDKGRT